MEVIHGSEKIPARMRRSVVTIGNFDGVHLGHRFIFRRLVEEARREGSPAVVISFEPHPKMVLHPERRPFYLITSPEEKIRLLAELEIDALILIPFSLDYARTTAETFVREILWERLQIRKILIGHDYTFGRGKEGNEAFLAEAGRRLGFAVEVMNAFCIGDTVISSTIIRDALLAGEVGFAATLLGRPYNLSGRVISGNRRGDSLGFPTANLLPDKELVPARGVYAVRCLLEEKRHDGVLNIGVNPTFADGKRSIEVHIFHFHRNIYGGILDVHFIERIRDEVRFTSPELLIAQIGRDIARAREILQSPK
jgi:riboflavin kinase/FMN adenylyltransferase